MHAMFFTFFLFSLISVQFFCKEMSPPGFKAFLKTHRKNYKTEQELYLRRFIWEDNLKYIEKFNQEADLGMHTYRLKMNAYGDFDKTEFLYLLNGYNQTLRSRSPAKNKHVFRAKRPEALPDSVDWRKSKRVTAIKDQGECGSCWAFATTGTLEGQLAAKLGRLRSLSEQQLVDCSNGYGSYGCDGGLPELALAYVRDNKGLSSESNYKYRAVQGSCKSIKNIAGFSITGIHNIESANELALQEAIATIGPIAVGIDASSDSFQFYSSGVYLNSDCRSDPNSLDHAVLVVGYGTDPTHGAYWIVKNSWGTTWGEDGYVRMARNNNNHCGIATDAVYATIA
jgi:cathepsin L